MIPINFIYYSAATVILVGGLVWKLASEIAALKVSVSTIQNNHLTHIEADIRDIKDYLKILFSHAVEAQQKEK